MTIKIVVLLLLYLRSSFRVFDDLAYLIDGGENKHYMNTSVAVFSMIAAIICYVHIVYLAPIMLMLFIEYKAASRNERLRLKQKEKKRMAGKATPDAA